MTVQTYTDSRIGPEKRRCGDFVLHVFDEAVGMHFVALSDGVGSHAFDWAASRQACESAAAAFAATEGEVAVRLGEAVAQAHGDVQNLEGEAAGATATLILVAFVENEKAAHFLSVGDSRLYRVCVDSLDRLTEDDSKSVPVKLGGKLVTTAGAVQFAAGLTRAVGYGGLGDVDIDTVELRNGESLVAVTDGYHELPGFEPKLAAACDRVDLAKGIQGELTEAHAGCGKDDATIAVLRRSELPVDDALESYRQVLDSESDFDNGGFFAHLMALVCLLKLDEFLDTGDSAGLLAFLQYMKRHDLVPPKQELRLRLRRVEASKSPDLVRPWNVLRELFEKAG